jgi:hypothetical protein
VEEVSSGIRSVIPELQSIYDAKDKHVHISYHDGIPGIQKIYEEIVRILPEDGEYFAYTGRYTRADPQYFTEKFWKLRDKKRLSRYVIA